MLLSNDYSSSTDSNRYYTSFSEGFDLMDEFTADVLEDLIEGFTDLSTFTNSMSNVILSEGKIENAKNVLRKVTDVSTKIFTSLSLWVNKLVNWIKSFIMKSTGWIKQNEKRFLINSEKYQDKDIKTVKTDIDACKGVISKLQGSLDHMSKTFNGISKDSISDLDIKENIHIKDLCGEENLSNFKKQHSHVTQHSLDVSELTSDCFAIEHSLKDIANIKSKLNKLKKDFNKFLTLFKNDELTPAQSSGVYRVTNYFKVSLGNIAQVLMAVTKLLSKNIKSNLKVLRRLV